MKTLGIYIPTWNRQNLLDRLLGTIEPQLSPRVEVFVSINKSDAEYHLPDWVRSRHTRINIGADANICPGPTLLNTDYAWVIGDDEQLQPHAIQHTLRAIDSEAGLILHPSVRHTDNMPWGMTFANYGEYVSHIIKSGAGWLIAAQTIISASTFLRTKYDVSLAVQKLDTRYGFHYGMLNNLFNEPVHFLAEPTMLYGSEASVYLEPKEAIDQHMSAYPGVIHDIFDWVSERIGAPIPHELYTHGFDVHRHT